MYISSSQSGLISDLLLQQFTIFGELNNRCLGVAAMPTRVLQNSDVFGLSKGAKQRPHQKKAYFYFAAYQRLLLIKAFYPPNEMQYRRLKQVQAHKLSKRYSIFTQKLRCKLSNLLSLLIDLVCGYFHSLFVYR